MKKHILLDEHEQTNGCMESDSVQWDTTKDESAESEYNRQKGGGLENEIVSIEQEELKKEKEVFLMPEAVVTYVYELIQSELFIQVPFVKE